MGSFDDGTAAIHGFYSAKKGVNGKAAGPL